MCWLRPAGTGRHKRDLWQEGTCHRTMMKNERGTFSFFSFWNIKITAKNTFCCKKQQQKQVHGQLLRPRLINLRVVHTVITSVIVPQPSICTCPPAVTIKFPMSTHHLIQSSKPSQLLLIPNIQRTYKGYASVTLHSIAKVTSVFPCLACSSLARIILLGLEAFPPNFCHRSRYFSTFSTYSS